VCVAKYFHCWRGFWLFAPFFGGILMKPQMLPHNPSFWPHTGSTRTLVATADFVLFCLLAVPCKDFYCNFLISLRSLLANSDAGFSLWLATMGRQPRNCCCGCMCEPERWGDHDHRLSRINSHFHLNFKRISKLTLPGKNADSFAKYI